MSLKYGEVQNRANGKRKRDLWLLLDTDRKTKVVRKDTQSSSL